MNFFVIFVVFEKTSKGSIDVKATKVGRSSEALQPGRKTAFHLEAWRHQAG